MIEANESKARPSSPQSTALTTIDGLAHCDIVAKLRSGDSQRDVLLATFTDFY